VKARDDRVSWGSVNVSKPFVAPPLPDRLEVRILFPDFRRRRQFRHSERRRRRRGNFGDGRHFADGHQVRLLLSHSLWLLLLLLLIRQLLLQLLLVQRSSRVIVDPRRDRKRSDVKIRRRNFRHRRHLSDGHHVRFLLSHPLLLLIRNLILKGSSDGVVVRGLDKYYKILFASSLTQGLHKLARFF
jgi:hypothetical protein